MKLGDEIIGVAAIMGAGEFDDTAIGEIGHALDEESGAAFSETEQPALPEQAPDQPANQ